MSIDDTTLSDATICDWYSYCREVCMVYLDIAFQNDRLIGGTGCYVEIDEAKIGKRKYNR